MFDDNKAELGSGGAMALYGTTKLVLNSLKPVKIAWTTYACRVYLPEYTGAAMHGGAVLAVKNATWVFC